ncbi:hypothetical protein V8E54_008008 [Elaphomyces granulatus]
MPLRRSVIPDIDQETSEKWRRVPESTETVLCNNMVKLFWLGVSREIGFLIDTLRSWREHDDVQGLGEVLQTDDMYGFRPFIDRAVGRSRGATEYPSLNREAAVRETIEDMQSNSRRLSKDQRRARMLLQGAGFLDISKLLTYRPPEEKINLWARPQAAQLTLDQYDTNTGLPNFSPLLCGTCSFVIRGTHFRRDNSIICESCMRKSLIQDRTQDERLYKKLGKRCILRETVTPAQIRRICTCGNNYISIIDGADNHAGFAVDGGQPHLQGCPVLQLGRHHERAKLDELRRKKNAHASQAKRGTISLRQRRGVRKIDGPSTRIQNSVFGRVTRALPLQITYGNVHETSMILLPITGIRPLPTPTRHDKDGAHISIRQPPQLTTATSDNAKRPWMHVSPQRKISQILQMQAKLRIKACMKQVVGSIFTSLASGEQDERELDIINALVETSLRPPNQYTSQSGNNIRMQQAEKYIVDKLRGLIGQTVTLIFKSIASKIFTVDLSHNFMNNDCQQFCANILDFKMFGSFFATSPACRIHAPPKPLYLVSFVCAPGSYDWPVPVRPDTKNTSPNGLTEEYLFRYRLYGHHEESDIIDTLMEYWHDWGNFGGPLYKHQNLFPWDCTEAYRKGEPERSRKCNNCSIVKHMWSFPFDAWSMIQLHIFKTINLYASQAPDGNALIKEWIRNRLNILSALVALNTVAVAMAKTESFRASCLWNREREAVSVDLASATDRLKLSGIHRAQPHSHFFEQGKYHSCKLAKWALSSRVKQIKEYETMRDHRAENLPEMPPRPQERNRHKHRNEHRDPDKQRSDNRFNISRSGISDSDSQPHRDVEEEYVDEEYVEEYFYYDELDENTGPWDDNGLLPTTFGKDPDGYESDDDDPTYHAPGSGICDYDRNNEWLDYCNADNISNDCRGSDVADHGELQSNTESVISQGRSGIERFFTSVGSNLPPFFNPEMNATRDMDGNPEYRSDTTQYLSTLPSIDELTEEPRDFPFDRSGRFISDTTDTANDWNTSNWDSGDRRGGDWDFYDRSDRYIFDMTDTWRGNTYDGNRRGWDFLGNTNNNDRGDRYIFDTTYTTDTWRGNSGNSGDGNWDFWGNSNTNTRNDDSDACVMM